MKTKIKLLLVALLGIFLLAAAGCGQKGSAPQGSAGSTAQTGDKQATATVKLRFANYFPEASGQGKIGQEFVEDIKKLTNGRVVVEYYPGTMLLGPDKMYDGVVQGIADIGLSNLGYTFGRFPQTEVLDLPLGFPNAWVANHVAVDFYNKFTPKEFNDVHMLTLHTSPVNNIITISAQVKKPEDLKGLKLRGTGYIAKLVEALGASAVPVRTPETYDALSKRVIDGVMLPWETIRTFKYGEVTKNAIEVWPLGQVYTFYIVMNKKTWDSLPPDLQKTITDYVQGDFSKKLTDMWNRVDIEGIKYAREAGYNIVQISPEDLPQWKQLADKVIEGYVNNMVSKGYSKEEVNSWISYVRERIDYWTKQQKEQGIKSSTGPEEVRVKL
ncbi:MAG: TRAP transporter substrate-binding protein DctP [Desulfotomaculales bacterium]